MVSNPRSKSNRFVTPPQQRQLRRHIPAQAQMPLKRGYLSYRKRYPLLETPEKRKGCALDLPLPAPICGDAAHAVQ